MFKENDLIKMSNEELVVLIQEANKDSNCDELQKNLYWEALFKKTERAIYQIYNKDVKTEYKVEMKDDIITILKTGWVKAVLKYDISRDNTKTCFVPFAQYVMYQEYVNNFAKKITSKKIGKSVNATLINNMHITKASIENTEKAKNRCADNIATDKHSEELYDYIEIKDLMNQKLNMLKRYHPKSYEMIIENIFNERTQNDIADEYNIKQASVARYIKKGKSFLKQIITKEEKEACLYNKKG